MKVLGCVSVSCTKKTKNSVEKEWEKRVGPDRKKTLMLNLPQDLYISSY